jgi:tRNA dimethylallyltransferase
LIRELAIVGATATGKSGLAHQFAEKNGGIIFSIDSLSIYREFDIISAKPSKRELSSVKYIGVDELNPDDKVSIINFIELYKTAKKEAEKSGVPLIIVGGSSFYLKSLLTGISALPEPTESIKLKVDEMLENLEDSYSYLLGVDRLYSEKIKPSDRYRIERGLVIYLSTGEKPSEYFLKNRPQPIIENLSEIYNIDAPRDELRKIIRVRTEKMIESGAIDEVDSIIKKYGSSIQPNRAIGVKEIIDFLNGEYDRDRLLELISIHTGQLAKRQQTFNRTQFRDYSVVSEPLSYLQKLL